jgi:hypothetical protein
VIDEEDRIKYSEKIKPDMKSIMASKPLIVRNNKLIPKYPKLDYASPKVLEMPVIESRNH